MQSKTDGELTTTKKDVRRFDPNVITQRQGEQQKEQPNQAQHSARGLHCTEARLIDCRTGQPLEGEAWGTGDHVDCRTVHTNVKDGPTEDVKNTKQGHRVFVC